jgi:anti-sigma factor RsiW
MNHDEWRERLSQFLDGESSAEEIQQVQAHLASCPECRTTMQAWEAVGASVRWAAVVELPSTFAADVRDSLVEREETSVVWGAIEPLARRAVEALAIIVIVVLSLEILVPSSEALAVDRPITSVSSDTGAAQVLMQNKELTKTDVLLAAVSE